MIHLLVSLILGANAQATGQMSPTSDVSSNRVRASGAPSSRALNVHVRTLPDAQWDAISVGSALVTAPKLDGTTGSQALNLRFSDLKTGFDGVNATSVEHGARLDLLEIGDVPYITSGATTARPDRERWSDVVNVKDFGACGNGVCDDTTAFQSAITSAAARGFALAPGGTVYVPPGNYRVTSALSVPLNVNLRGDGFGSLLSFVSGTDGLVITPGGDGQITRWDGLRIAGNGTAGTAGIRHAYAATPDRNLLVESMHIEGFEFGAYLQSMWFTTFRKCNIITPQGLVFKGWNIKIAVDDSHMAPPTSRVGYLGPFYGVHQIVDDVNELGKAAEDFQIRNATHIEQYDYNVWISRALFASVSDSDLDYFQSRGVVVEWALGGLTIADNWVAMDASTAATNVAGIDLSDTTSDNFEAKVIRGNRVAGLSKAISYGIGIGAKQHRAVVRDNYVAGFDEGVRISSAKGVRVRDNTFSDNATAGVNALAGARVYATDNESGTDAFNVHSVAGGAVVNRAERTRAARNVSALAFQAAAPVDANLGDLFAVTVISTAAYGFAEPTNGYSGQEISISVFNASGSAMYAASPFGAGYSVGTWTAPANGKNTTITLRNAGATWYEVARSANDVSN